MFRIILIAVLAVQSIAQTIDCGDKATTCDKCMAKGPPCVWCYDPDYKNRNQGPQYRCAKLQDLLERGCSEKYTVETISEYSAARNDSPIETANKTIQLYPQEINVLLRPNDPLTIDVGYQQALNYPVDLYYLTDMSYSMYKHLTVVSQQAQIIAQTMKKLTTKFRMGFGKFVDKPVNPYIDPRPQALEDPCMNLNLSFKCESPYGYRHILDLTSNISKFQQVTNSTKPSGNVDGPEGGLDALVQAALCDSVIGWNSFARKIVLFTSDAEFHMAGDGRIGGIIRRFENKCHMQKLKDGTSYYNMSTELDYPSVGQVASILESKGIAVIFAITEQYYPLYQSLAKILPPAAVGILKGDSDNIAALIRDNYAQISSSIGLVAHIPDDRLKVRIVSICPNDTEASKKEAATLGGSNMCHGLPLGGRVGFKVEIVSSECLDKPVNVTLKPYNLEGEVIVLNVATSCSCEGKCGKPIVKAKQCSEGRGNLSCGVCHCEKGFSGDFCECSADVSKSTDNCINKEKDKDEFCSGRGSCECGSCRCHSDRYQGALCECDMWACPRANDDRSVCGGATRGSCNCNRTCTCKPGYKGDACDCLIDKSFCRGNGTVITSPAVNASALETSSSESGNSSEVLCSGHGTCDCGVCVCTDEWTGLTCSEPRGGEGRLCQDQDIRHCVLCLLAKHLGEDDVTDTDCTCQSSLVDEKLVTFIDDHDKQEASSLCVMYDESDCRVYFMYRWESAVRQERRLLVSIQRQRECPDRTNIILIVAAVILLVVLIGILLLILWKVCVTIQDRRAEADTMKFQDQALFEAGENPIYLPPITTVHNPLCEMTPKL